MKHSTKDVAYLVEMVLGDYAQFCLDNSRHLDTVEEQTAAVEGVKSMVRVCYALADQHHLDPVKADVDQLAKHFNLV